MSRMRCERRGTYLEACGDGLDHQREVPRVRGLAADLVLSGRVVVAAAAATRGAGTTATTGAGSVGTGGSSVQYRQRVVLAARQPL